MLVRRRGWAGRWSPDFATSAAWRLYRSPRGLSAVFPRPSRSHALGRQRPNDDLPAMVAAWGTGVGLYSIRSGPQLRAPVHTRCSFQRPRRKTSTPRTASSDSAIRSERPASGAKQWGSSCLSRPVRRGGGLGTGRRAPAGHGSSTQLPDRAGRARNGVGDLSLVTAQVFMSTRASRFPSLQ